MSVATLIRRAIDLGLRHSIEFLFRIPDLTRPSSYIRSLRVKSIAPGQKCFPDRNYAIFAIRPYMHVPRYIYATIAVLDQLRFNVIVVTNKRLTACDQAALSAQTNAIITRNGRGRDFGGFKDAILHLLKDEVPNSILLLNDSVYYIAAHLQPAFSELVSSSRFATFTEVYEKHYHAQANCLFFSSEAIKDVRFQHFWTRYWPISTRTYAICKGEVGITREMLRAGFSPAVIFNRERLVRAIKLLPFEELIGTWRFLPNEAAIEMKLALTQLERDRRIELNDQVSRGRKLPHESVRLASQASGRATGGLEISASNVHQFRMREPDAGVVAAIDQYYTEEARELVIEKVNHLMDDRNALHACGLLLAKYTGLPVIKRDMAFRNIYRESTLETFADENAPELLHYIREDNRLKGNSKHFSLFRQMLYRYNII
jgi:hypothetical protein